MKVLVITCNLDLPEAHLYEGLAAAGFNIKVILDPDSPFLEHLKNPAISIIKFRIKNRFNFSSIKFIRSEIKNFRPDIIHTFSARALSNALIAGIGLGAKHVTYRGTSGHLSRLDPSAWMSFLNPAIARIICVSDAVREYMLSKGVPAERLTRIYKGHDINWYRRENKFDLSQFEIPGNSFVITCSANMRPVKGVDILVEALNYLPDDVKVFLLLIGEVRDHAVHKVLRDCKRSDFVKFTGFRRDAAAIVGSSRVFCMPSREREGLPKAAIEAMSQFVPAIVSNVGGMPELVHDGKEGCVFQTKNARELAAKIEYLYRNPEILSRMSQNAGKRIEKDFNINSTISETIDVYNQVAG